MKSLLAGFIFLGLFCGCSKKDSVTERPPVLTPPVSPVTPQEITYLALGDSYTIGQAVKQSESFPYLLAAELKNYNFKVTNLKIIAKTGWTTTDLQNSIDQEQVADKFDLVTLLIGVNNQYAGLSIDTYRAEFIKLLNEAVGFAGNNKQRVFVLSIPDWGMTPFGGSGARPAISAQIDAFNAVNKEEAAKLGVAYVDITEISREVRDDPFLVADDRLHPSEKMYHLWVDKMFNQVTQSLK